jgi:hypothetical protein
MTTRERTLTATQRDALDRVRAALAAQTARLQRDIDADPVTFSGCRPSPWICVVTLTDTHHIPYRSLKALVRKGRLESRPTDGFGNEVRPVAEEAVR